MDADIEEEYESDNDDFWEELDSGKKASGKKNLSPGNIMFTFSKG